MELFRVFYFTRWFFVRSICSFSSCLNGFALNKINGFNGRSSRVSPSLNAFFISTIKYSPEIFALRPTVT